MKSSILLFVILLASCSSTFGQGNEISEIRKYNNHIDLDIKNIFDRLSGASLIYKRKYQSGRLVDVKRIKLIRFLASIDTQISFTGDPTRDNSTNINIGLHPSNLVDIQLGVGLENQVMYKGFVHYTGVDFLLRFYSNDDDFENGDIGGVINNFTLSTDRTIRTITAGFNPFFGIKYYFNERISLGIETGFSLIYFNQTINEVEITRLISSEGESFRFDEIDSLTSSGLAFTFNKLRFLTVGYTF